VAERAGVAAFEVEIICSDQGEQRRRVESRQPDITGHALPTWREASSVNTTPGIAIGS